jgi:mRNA interferase RelE/StbE
MYKITIIRSAEKDLKKLDRQAKNRLVNEILALASQPRPQGCRRVVSEERLWRIRAGDWRIGYEINDSEEKVTVIRIGHRSEFYDR